MGEFLAFCMGWNLILVYLIGNYFGFAIYFIKYNFKNIYIKVFRVTQEL
jgi:hypothetical protein